MSDNKVVLIGYSGHGYVVADTALSINMKLESYAEIDKIDINPYDLEYIGFEMNPLFDGWNKNYSFILGIGDNKLRQKVSEFVLSKDEEILNVIHETSCISKGVEIGKGNFISKNTSINPLVKINDFCIVNTGAVIEHECEIESAVHIAPRAVLLGNVKVGERSFIGANSVIKQGVTIGSDVIIGAGSVVLKNIPNGKKIVGNPCREI